MGNYLFEAIGKWFGIELGNACRLLKQTMKAKIRSIYSENLKRVNKSINLFAISRGEKSCQISIDAIKSLCTVV